MNDAVIEAVADTSQVVEPVDPLVAVLAWAMAALCGRFIPEHWRPALPAIAVVSACAIRAAYDATSASGDGLTAESFARGLGAAGVAVLGHSQVREIGKVWEKREEE